MKYLSETSLYLNLVSEDASAATKYLDSFTEEEQAKILLLSKIVIAKVSLDSGINMSGKCYDCKYRRNIPGDCHSAYANKVALAIGDDHGIQNGWFIHPFNFDPIWLKYCDGFEKMDS